MNKIPVFVRKYKNRKLPDWDNEMQMLSNESDTIQYYFFIDSINFCYWSQKKENKWRYKAGNSWINGYYAMSYAIKEAFNNNPKLLQASYLAELPLEEFKNIFIGKGELLLLPERHAIIRENFALLQKHFKGKAINICKEAQFNTNEIVDILYVTFPSFRDEISIDGHHIHFLKRAQIFPSDINYALSKSQAAYIRKLQDITVFPDYKLPQLLHYEGIFDYEDNLLQKITNNELIPSGSEEEIEIRACTILAGELLRKEFEKNGREITSSQLDWML